MNEILTPIGLVLDGLGATLLLAPEYKPVDGVARKFDPIYQSNKHLAELFHKRGWEKRLVDMGK